MYVMNQIAIVVITPTTITDHTSPERTLVNWNENKMTRRFSENDEDEVYSDYIDDVLHTV